MDHGNVAILTAYCARGSLEDVLMNEDLHLDNMFVSSLVADIVKVSLKEVKENVFQLICLNILVLSKNWYCIIFSLRSQILKMHPDCYNVFFNSDSFKIITRRSIFIFLIFPVAVISK